MTTEPVEPSPADAPPPAAPPAPAVPPAAPPAEPSLGLPTEAAPASAPVRRRPRPVLLLTSALVLGTVLGGAVGYGIQAQRPPTPLPPLQVARPAYPAEVVDPAAAAAAAPRPLAVDGDLRKLLITRPDGSEVWGDYPDTPSWVSVGDLAERDGKADVSFKDYLREGLRRAAGVSWKKGGVKYRVTLLQYGPDRAAEAMVRAKNFSLKPFVEGVNGGYRVESSPDYWAESTEQYYYGYAVARRGTVVLEVEVYAPQAVQAEDLKDIAKRQWERLT
ncbi:hypothetical protein ACFVVX_03960 [Kitasatospora sp. NPDC058170]|uniref:hypothetical protein n=1 Tax=Kitasatospora sp. NPDC058170 TaxID=3346364 RepID=UPI0036DA0D01